MGIDHRFAGHALNAVDAKGRVSVPAALRGTVAQRLRMGGAVLDDKGGTLHIGAHWKGDRLVAYDQVGLNQLADSLVAQVADLPAAERNDALDELRQERIVGLIPVPYDGAGRMVLSPLLREFGGIGDLAFFTGVDDHIEVWAPDRYEAAFAGKPMLVAALRSCLKGREA